MCRCEGVRVCTCEGVRVRECVYRREGVRVGASRLAWRVCDFPGM